MCDKFNLHFGALAKPIEVQLREQSITWREDHPNTTNIAMWQKDADAITRLRIRGLISDLVAHRAQTKLIRKIGAKSFKEQKP